MTTKDIFTELFSGDMEIADAARELGCQPYELEAWLGFPAVLLSDYTPAEATAVAGVWDEDEAEVFPLNDSDSDIF